jgi:hypothetical protein
VEGAGEEGWQEGGWDRFGAHAFLIALLSSADSPGPRPQALSDTFFWEFWSAGIYKIVGDLAQTTSPLVTRKIIQEVQAAYLASRAGQPLPSIGLGIGLSFVLLVQQMYVFILFSFSFSSLTYRLAHPASTQSVRTTPSAARGKSVSSLEVLSSPLPASLSSFPPFLRAVLTHLHPQTAKLSS